MVLPCFLPQIPPAPKGGWLHQQNLQKNHLLVGGGRNARFVMGRTRKDALTADGSSDPADLQEDEDLEEEQSQEEQEEDAGGEDREEEEEHEEEAAGETAEQDRTAEGLPPKLADGFYEIEAIRRRRRHRGQLQYLVKWRWWPESANTWEPVGNLKACSDMIYAFEKRRSPKSSRKRKRKTTTTPTTDPNPSRGKRGRPPRSEARSLPHPPAVPKILPSRTSSRRASNNSNKTSFGGLEASVNGLGRLSLEEGSSGVVLVGFPSQGPPLSISLTHQQDEHHPVNALPMVSGSVQAPPPQGGQVTGAKKRKSGCVRRFKLDETTTEQGHHGRTSEKPGNEYVDSTEGEIVDKNKGEECGNQVHITKIIKPVRYFATITDGVQQVSITFRALRSDGQEVIVDDKQLKAQQPLVLIDYYEQHLRYNPTS